MRASLKSALLVAGLSLLPAAANAATVSISRKVGIDELERICAASGGIFWSDLGGYSCTVKNCDGKGNSCYVACSTDGVCSGTVPRKVPFSGRLKDILVPHISQNQQ